MSNIKRWADHDSSDDDEDHHHARGHARGAPPEEEEEPNVQEEEGLQEQQEQQDNSLQDQEQPPQQPQQPTLRKESYDLPTEAPFTAFVGGLAFSVKDPDHLAQAITDLVYNRFQQEINVVHARVMIDKNDGKHRGFGYVEVETLDQLKTVLQLDDGQSNIAGRRIQLDTATKKDNRGGSNNRLNRATSAGSIPEVDGSKFRAGRFARKNSNEPAAGGGGTNEGAPEEFRQRPSLKLQPRSKPREGGMEDSTSSLTSASNIFGGGRARDEQAWERRSSETIPKATAGAKEGEAEEPKDGPPPPQQQQQPQYQQQGDRARRSSTGRSIRGGDGPHQSGRGERHHSGRVDHHHSGRGDHHHTGRSGDRGGSGGRSGGRSGGERGRGGPSNRSAGGRVTSANPRTAGYKKDAPAAGAPAKEDKKVAPVVKQVPANKIVSPPTVQEPEKTDVKKPTNKFALLSLDSDSD